MVFIEMNHNEMDLFLEPDQYVVMHPVAHVAGVAGYFIFAENSHDVQTKLSQIGCDACDVCDTSSKTPNTHKPMKKAALRGDDP